jgi:hypothetical protein
MCGKVYTVDLRTNNDSLCTPCFDRAGDDNSVADGAMTCAEYRGQYGDHSEYCYTDPECGGAIAVDDEPVSMFMVEVRHGLDAFTSTGDIGDLPTVVAVAKRFRSVGWDVQIVQRTVVFTGTDLDEDDAPAVVNADGTPTSYTVAMLTGVPQHRRAATPVERAALNIPSTCVADKRGDCITHFWAVKP